MSHTPFCQYQPSEYDIDAKSINYEFERRGTTTPPNLAYRDGAFWALKVHENDTREVITVPTRDDVAKLALEYQSSTRMNNRTTAQDFARGSRDAIKIHKSGERLIRTSTDALSLLKKLPNQNKFQ